MIDFSWPEFVAAAWLVGKITAAILLVTAVTLLFAGCDEFKASWVAHWRKYPPFNRRDKDANE